MKALVYQGQGLDFKENTLKGHLALCFQKDKTQYKEGETASAKNCV